MRIDFDKLINTDKPPMHISNKQLAQWHYFSKAGLYAQWRTMCHAISADVYAGNVPSGYIVAYGSFNDYSANRIIELATKKKRVGWAELASAISCLGSDIDAGYNSLIEATKVKAA